MLRPRLSRDHAMNMPMDHRPQRRSLRMSNYDYRTPGAYFVTICTHDRRPLFADMDAKRIAHDRWNEIPAHFPRCELDEFVVMPNHVHGIVWITPDASGEIAAAAGTAAGSLSAVLRSYKAAVTREVRALGSDSIIVWQRNYFEHVIRTEASLDRIRQYIVDNPGRWAFDRDNPRGTPDAHEASFWDDLGQ